MKIECVEVQNFRKLRSTHIDFDREQTLFVGANNSGKTSAMLALRYFLIERTSFSYRDVSVGNWHAVNQLGETWEKLRGEEDINADDFLTLLPAIDIWLQVGDSEIHHVAHLLPTLDWTGGSLGVRMRLEPKDIRKLFTEFRLSRENARTTIVQAGEKNSGAVLSVWPKNLLQFLDKRMRALVTVNSYVLDPDKRQSPLNGVARPQPLPAKRVPLNRDPWQGLIRIDEIAAQRNLSDASPSNRSSDDDADGATRPRRRLSEQLRQYYNRHLDPAKSPTEADIDALIAIQSAEQTFDARLKKHFHEPIKELEGLGYPGIADPRVTINTRFRPTDGLQHASAVQYEVAAGAVGTPLRLPEDYSGLGYQNLISMVFMLMSFRDDWMQIGKRAERGPGDEEKPSIPPLHLVLVEEPEAHLHAQVQQVFIKKAYELLRKHPDLGDLETLATQLVVSTHSSHIAHEVDFKCLRYFRRAPLVAGTDASTTTVANLSTLFGSGDATLRFVSRYLKATHCDLFFADAAILVEGQAERILVPHFIRHRYKDLDRRYITLLELGGAHAHRLKPLIEALGLTTLIIADVDAVTLTDSRWRAAAPQIGSGQKTSNEVLKTWHPAIEDLDALMQLQPSGHERRIDGQPVLYVSFQKPIGAETAGVMTTIIPRTFEDAFVFANQAIVESMGEEPLTKKIAALVAQFKDQPEVLADELFELLKKAEKAAFALDILMHDPPKDVVPPPYITDGLTWLDRELAPATSPAPPQVDLTVSKRATQ
jgi:predicted ATP-dependent endonuclease of OLD family